MTKKRRERGGLRRRNRGRYEALYPSHSEPGWVGVRMVKSWKYLQTRGGFWAAHPAFELKRGFGEIIKPKITFLSHLNPLQVTSSTIFCFFQLAPPPFAFAPLLPFHPPFPPPPNPPSISSLLCSAGAQITTPVPGRWRIGVRSS